MNIMQYWNKGKALIKVFFSMCMIFPFYLKNVHRFQLGLYCLCILVGDIWGLLKLLTKKLNKQGFLRILESAGMLLLLWLASCVIPILYRTNDFSYFIQLARNITRIGAMVALAVLCKDRRQYIMLYIKACALYVAFSIALLLPPLHNFYSGIVYERTDIALEKMEVGMSYYTRFGLKGFSGFGCTVLCTIAVALCCYELALKPEKKLKSSLHCLLILNLVGAAFYGRSGMITSLVCIGFTEIYLALKDKNVKRFFSIMGIAVCVIALGTLMYLNIEKIAGSETFSWLLEPLINMLSGRGFSSSSTNTLFNRMYIMPSFKTFLMGDGRYTENGHYYMRTDAGFLRPLFFWGIFGSIIYYSIFFDLIRGAKKWLTYEDTNKGKLFAVLLCIVFVLFEIKGETNLFICGILFGLNIVCLLEKTDHKPAARP